MTVIYEATEDRPHFCTTANASLPVGSICRCDCGRFWLRKTVIGDYWVYRWVPVRWYHRAARKRIKAWERPGGETPVQTVDEAYRLVAGQPQTLTNKTVLNPTPAYVEAQKARLKAHMAQAKEKVKADSRKLYLTRAGADGEQAWREADDTTPTRFRVTVKFYPSPFAAAPGGEVVWMGTKAQVIEMASEFSCQREEEMLHMEIDRVEVIDG